MKKTILNPISIIYIGLFVGMMAKYFDLHTEILGNLFSQLPIWILIGVLIAVYSENEIEDIDEFLKLNIPHISCYSLIIEDNTVFGISNREYIDQDKDLEMYKYIDDKLNYSEIKDSYIPLATGERIGKIID